MELNLPHLLFSSLSEEILPPPFRNEGSRQRRSIKGSKAIWGTAPAGNRHPHRALTGFLHAAAPAHACPLALVPRSSVIPTAFPSLRVQHPPLRRLAQSPRHRPSDTPLLPLASTCSVILAQTHTAHFQITAPNPLPAHDISLSAS